ncbi:MAG: hypothetical protein EON93_10935 [Burkholderiales bacterium]|nr:MAG: hypothetical protein EON93_10935 [Burkholderiales bacterium]
MTAQLQRVMVAELPPMQLLSNADDRLNLARACAQVRAPWLPAYIARAVAEEETGEKARGELVEALFSSQARLTDTFALLAQAFSTLRPSTESPGDTVGRRLARTLTAVRPVLLESELEAGDGLGRALESFVAAPLSEVGRPQEEKVQVELAREALLTIHDLVRTRISVSADPEMYGLAAYCRRLCGGHVWPPSLRKPLDRLVTDVCEAIVLLGRQDQCHQELVDQLAVLCDYPERARAVSREIAAKHPELPEHVRDWLERGRRRVVKAASDAAVEAAASSADESIGLALQAARQLRQAGDALRAPLHATLEIYEPNLAPAATELMDRVRVLAVQLEQAAQMRGLGLHGAVGEEIEMSAKYFNAVRTSHRTVMKVVQPAVVRVRSDGSPGDVVTKGLVE